MRSFRMSVRRGGRSWRGRAAVLLTALALAAGPATALPALAHAAHPGSGASGAGGAWGAVRPGPGASGAARSAAAGSPAVRRSRRSRGAPAGHRAGPHADASALARRGAAGGAALAQRGTPAGTHGIAHRQGRGLLPGTAVVPGTRPGRSPLAGSPLAGRGSTAARAGSVVRPQGTVEQLTDVIASLTVGFADTTINTGGTTKIIFNLAQQNLPTLAGTAGHNTEDISGITFWVTLPTDLVVASGTIDNTCLATITADAGSGTIKVESTTSTENYCVVRVPITSSVPGTYNLDYPGSFSNLSPQIDPGNILPDNGPLTVVSPETDLTAAFSRISMSALDTLDLTLTLTATDALGRDGLGFTFALPSQFVVTGTVSLSAGCTGTAPAPSLFAGTVTATGLGIQADLTTCVITVPLTAIGSGTATAGAASVSGLSGVTNQVGALSVTVIPAPTLTAAFPGSPVSVGTMTNLTLVFGRDDASLSSATLAYTLPLPAGLSVAGTQSMQGACDGTLTGGPGDTTISLSGGTMPGDVTSCTVTVPLTASGPGTYALGSASFTGFQGFRRSVSASLTVIAGPNIVVSFAPGSFTVGGSTTLSLQLVRDVTTAATAPLAFTLNLPSGLTVAPDAVPQNDCGGDVGGPDVNTIMLLGGALDVGVASCTISVPLTSSVADTYTVTGDNFAEIQGMTTAIVAQSVTVTAAPPSLTLAFDPTSVQVGGVSTLSIAISRPGGPALTGLSFTVNLPAGLAVAAGTVLNTCAGTLGATVGGASVGMSGLALATSATGCTLGVPVTPSTAGDKVIADADVTAGDGLTVDVGTRTLSVALQSQTITFDGLPDVSLAAGSVTLAATASSQLAVVYTAGPDAVCTVAGTLLTLHGAGTCTVHADQPGNATYAAAPQVTRAFTVAALGAPMTVTATAGVSSITARWQAPADLTGVTGYTATASPGPASCSTSGALTCVMGGTAGVTYTITVVAHTSAGDSPASGASNAVTPTAPVPPSAPPGTTLTLTTDKGQITTADPGQRIVFIGTGFAPFSTVVITIYSAPVVLGTVVTDAHGDFSKPITIPPGLSLGGHTTVAQGVAPDGTPRAMKLAITVRGAAAATTGGLPVTGADLTGIASTGTGLLALGTMLCLAARRRTGR